MSNEEAEALMDTYDKWDAKQAKHEMIHRNEKKLGRRAGPRRK